jgi:hypothetical protein
MFWLVGQCVFIQSTQEGGTQMEHISLSAELGEIRYAIEDAHWIADSVAMGAVPDPERTHSVPVIISAILLLVENRLHQLGRVLRGEENPAHLLTHNVTTGEYADKEDVVLQPWDWSGASRPYPSEKKKSPPKCQTIRSGG